jgi:hypothetical protein
MRVLGIDPGAANCGFGVLEVGDAGVKPVVVDAGTFRTDKRDEIKLRLRELSRDLGGLIAEHKPAVIACEAPSILRDAKATAWLWAAYGCLLGVANGHAMVFDRGSDDWRTWLGLPTGRQLTKRGILTANARRAEHKRLTAALIKTRFPSILRLLASAPRDAWPHAFDAAAIALAWVASAAPTSDLAASAPRDTHA